MIYLVFPFSCDVGGDAEQLQSESGFPFGDVFHPRPPGGTVAVSEHALEACAFDWDENHINKYFEKAVRNPVTAAWELLGWEGVWECVHAIEALSVLSGDSLVGSQIKGG